MSPPTHTPYGGRWSLAAALAACLLLVLWLGLPREEGSDGLAPAQPTPVTDAKSERPAAVPGAPPPAGDVAKRADDKAPGVTKSKQIKMPPGKELGGIDLRQAAAGPAPAQEAAMAKLKASYPGAEVRFDAVTGAPDHIQATGKLLTGPAKEGSQPREAVENFMREHADLFPHRGDVLAQSRVTRDDVTAHSGMRTMVWQQEVDGIPVWNAILKANLTRKGELITLGSHYLPDAAAATRMDDTQRQALVAQPPIDAAQAVVLAAEGLALVIPKTEVRPDIETAGAERRQKFSASGLSDTQAGLAWFAMNPDEARLTWDVTLMSTQLGEMFQVLVDATTGETLLRRSLTNDISDATYRVFADPVTKKPADSPTPFSPSHPSPSSVQPPAINRSLVTVDALNLTASPNGWIDDGGTETIGNNVAAHTDFDAQPNSPDLPRPSSATRTFDFAMDTTLAPNTYRDAAVTQLFYYCNWIHDKLYELGFTETAGNFQQSNFSRGGLGNDRVQADAQDGSGTDNANFSTPADGSSGRMQMYVFIGPNPDIDGDFDGEIVIHEYGHGLSNRLVGGGVGISALQTRGMGEGWSDFYGLSLLSDSGDDLHGCYAAGGYATRQLGGLAENYYFGIRRYPYSTNMLKNPLTFKDIDGVQASPHTGIPRSPVIGNTATSVHNQGEVWCSALWEARANLITKHGYTIGNQRILQLVTDAMKLSPANPNMLQARDAILQADLANNSGEDRAELWSAFAKRGMGFGATSPASSTTTGVVESYAIPDDLLVSPAAAVLATGEAGGPFTPSASNYTLLNTGTFPLNWTASDNQAWLDLSESGGILAAGASTSLTASLNAAASGLPNGLHTATITFTNTTSGAAIVRTFSLRIGQPDYFTELFDTSLHDIDNQSFFFTPSSGSNGYSVTRQPTTVFLTSPAGGTSLPMSDDTYVQVTPSGGQQVRLYGTSYSTFYVSSNGYITFGSGSSSYSESLSLHFSLPRISALLDDLLPVTGQVTWRQTAELVAVTWQNVPEFSGSTSNSLQIEMFFDGRIRITHLAVGATDGLVGLSRGQGTPADFVESDFSLYSAGKQLSVILPVAAVEGAGVLTDQGSVQVVPIQPSDTVVALVSDAVAEVGVPLTVTIPAGQAGVTFSPFVEDDSVLDGSQRAVVMASAPSFSSGQAVMTVHDNETSSLTVVVPEVAVEGDGGTTGSVTIDATAGRPVTVSLSSNSTAAQVPATMQVPAGQSSGIFLITTPNDNLITGTRTATITAQVQGWTTGTDAVAVQDNESTQLVVTAPSSVLESQGTLTGVGQVVLAGAVSNDLVVDLQSGDPSALSVPPTVTVPAGQSSASYSLTVIDNANATGNVVVAISAMATGFTGGAAQVTVVDDENPALTSSPSPAHGSTSTGADSDLAWNYLPATGGIPQNYDVYFGTSPSPGSAQLLGNTTVKSWVLPRLNPGTTYFWRVDSRLGGEVTQGQVWSFVVPAAGPAARFSWSTIGDPQQVNGPFQTTVTAYDQFDNVATGFSGTVGISAVQSLGNMIISEVETITTDQIELTNAGTTPVDLSGWTLHIYDIVSYPAPLPVFTFPAGSVCQPGDTVRVVEEGFPPGSGYLFYTGVNINWNADTTTKLAVLLRKADGAAVDFFCAATGLPGSITVPQTIPASHWAGAPRTGPTTAPYTYVRSGASDNNSAADWILANSSLGVANPQLTLPFPSVISNLEVEPAVTTPFVSGIWQGDVRVRQPSASLRLQAQDASVIKGLSNSFSVVSAGTLAMNVANTTPSEGGGTLTGAVTLTLPAVAAQDVTAQIVSSDLTEVGSATLLIPAGQLSGSADLMVLNDALLDGARPVIMEATIPGYEAARVNLFVQDDETAALSMTLPSPVTEGDGVLTGHGTITASMPVSEDFTISLVSSDITEVEVPASVTLAAGQASVSFDLTVVDDGVFDEAQTADVTASHPGWSSITKEITINDNEVPTLTLIAPAAVNEGGTATITVSVGAALLAPLTVALSGDAGVQIPASVTIPEQASSATFTITASDDAVSNASFVVNISATAPLFTPASASVTVLNNDPHHFAIKAIGTAQNVNEPFSVVVTALDEAGNVLPAYAGTLNLSAQAGSSPVPMTPTATGAFHDGIWLGNVLIPQTESSVVLTATEVGGGLTVSSNAFSLGVSDPPVHFVVSGLPSAATSGVSVPVTITAKTAQGATATTYNSAVNLYPAAPGIGEIPVGRGSTNTSHFFQSIAHDQRTQILYTAGELGGFARQITGLAVNVGTTSAAPFNLTLRMKHTTAQTITSSVWQSTDWVTVFGGSATFNATGWKYFSFSTPFNYDGTSNLWLDVSFDGTAVPVSSILLSSDTSLAASALYATSNSLHGAPTTWSGSNPYPFSATIRPQLRLVTAGGVVLSPTRTTGSFINGVWTGNVVFTGLARDLCLFVQDSSGRSGVSAPLQLGLGGPVLFGEFPYTQGTTNGVGWSPVSGATSYEAERSPGGIITTAASPASWTGLTDGALYTYRARTAKSLVQGPDAWSQDSWSDFTVDTHNGTSAQTQAGSVTLVPGSRVLTDSADRFESTSGAWSTFFPVTGGNTGSVFATSALSAGPNTSPPLPINQGGDMEGRFSNSTYLWALAADTPQNKFSDGVIEGYVSLENWAAFISTGLMLRAEKTGINSYTGCSVTLNCSTATSASIYIGIRPSMILAGSISFPYTPGEVLRLRLQATGSKLMAQAWRVSVAGGRVVETPVVLSGTSTVLTAYDSTFTHGRAGVYASGSSTANATLFDDITVTQVASTFNTSGSVLSPVIAPTVRAQWGRLTFDSDVSGIGSAISVDVLDSTSNLLAAAVPTGTDLSTIPAVASASDIRLRAGLSTTDTSLSPVLKRWAVGITTPASVNATGPWSAPVSSRQDASAPSVTIATPRQSAYTTSTQVAVSGTALDTISGISSVSVNGTAATTSSGFSLWSAVVSIPLGQSAIAVVARDGALSTPNLGAASRLVTRLADTDGDKLPFDWESANGLNPYSSAGEHGLSGDLDRDGRTNLLEYAFNTRPNAAEADPCVSHIETDTNGLSYLHFVYPRRFGALNLAYSVEVSDDLNTWSSPPGQITEIGSVPSGDGITELVTVRLSPALVPGAQRFVHVKVTAQ